MTPTLYFLRSSEQKIVTTMLTYAMRLDDTGKQLQDLPEVRLYEQYYGLTNKDLGLYALMGHEVAGAAWLRVLKADDPANAFIDEKTPILTIGVKPGYRGQGIGSIMLEQLIQEAGVLYEKISVSVVSNSPVIKFYERFGFEKVDDSVNLSPVDGSKVVTMVRKLSGEAPERPSDGYDPRRWMD